jgi:hypothetical protein
MRTLRHFAATAMIYVCAGCSSSGPERIVRLEDTELGKPVANMTVTFTHSRESWMPGADVPLFGPDTDIVEVPLDANGEARIHLPRKSWWASIDRDGTRSGHAGTSIESSNIRDGGVFRLYQPPPTIADTNIYPSKFVLIIKKS